jgi:hypothetical protein
MVTRPLARIKHEIGHAYIAVTRHERLSSHDRPSTAVVLEDGIPLPGPANAPHDDIRRFGGGMYSFWHDSVYFSTPDNSDPAANGRKYSIRYKHVSLDRIAAIIPDRLYRLGGRTSARIADLFRIEKWRQAWWGGLYWLCFAWVLRRGGKPTRERRG